MQFPDPGVDPILDIRNQRYPDLTLVILSIVVKLRQFELEHVLALRGLRVEHVRGELLDRQPDLQDLGVSLQNLVTGVNLGEPQVFLPYNEKTLKIKDIFLGRDL